MRDFKFFDCSGWCRGDRRTMRDCKVFEIRWSMGGPGIWMDHGWSMGEYARNADAHEGILMDCGWNMVGYGRNIMEYKRNIDGIGWNIEGVWMDYEVRRVEQYNVGGVWVEYEWIMGGRGMRMKA